MISSTTQSIFLFYSEDLREFFFVCFSIKMKKRWSSKEWLVLICDFVYLAIVCVFLFHLTVRSLQLQFGSHIITMQDYMLCFSVAAITVDVTHLIPIFLLTLNYKIWFITFYYVMSNANWSFTLWVHFFISFFLLSLENPSLTPFVLSRTFSHNSFGHL